MGGLAAAALLFPTTRALGPSPGPAAGAPPPMSSGRAPSMQAGGPPDLVEVVVGSSVVGGAESSALALSPSSSPQAPSRATETPQSTTSTRHITLGASASGDREDNQHCFALGDRRVETLEEADMAAARAAADPRDGLVVEVLARTGRRASELCDLEADAVVRIGDGHWMRVPVGKLRNGRSIPLHPDQQRTRSRPNHHAHRRIMPEPGSRRPAGGRH